MRQFVLPSDWDGSPDLRLGGRESRHLIRVLRLVVGDRFPAIDAGGRPYTCEIQSIEAGMVRVAVFPRAPEARPEAELPDLRGGKVKSDGAKAAGVGVDEGHGIGNRIRRFPRIILAAALLKGEKFDLVLRQATEAGVSRIIPLATARSLGLPSSKARLERQHRIIREALQQSGSPIPTSFEESAELRDLPARLGRQVGTRLPLLLHETPLAEASLHEYLGQRPDEIVVCVGPEGGFAPEEVTFLLDAGFLPLHLPGAVLRAETAALYAIAAIEIVAAEHDSWIRAQT
ncbi:MAG TPA: RsmE family RNA methyltransferase [Rectinemataceae bacterium]|nr:RsmE family RNA methyltransferase [Rectinemataceae bacterium]